MNKEKQHQFKTINKTTLALAYGTPLQTLKLWLEPIENEISCYLGKSFNPKQVAKISSTTLTIEAQMHQLNLSMQKLRLLEHSLEVSAMSIFSCLDLQQFLLKCQIPQIYDLISPK